MDWLGGLLSGGLGALGSLGGAFMNSQAQEATNAANIAWQTEFAQNGIQWKVEDAKKAGINPLAALGAQTSSFSNLVAPQPGAGMADAGQNIARAIQAMKSPEEKALAAYKSRLDLESQELDNEHKRIVNGAAATTAFQPGTPPGISPPSTRYLLDGQPPTALPGSSHVKGSDVTVEPDKRTATDAVNLGTTAGTFAESSWGRDDAGWYTRYPSKDFQAHTSNDTISNLAFHAKYHIPVVNDEYGPPAHFKYGSKYYWERSPSGSYRLREREPNIATPPYQAPNYRNGYYDWRWFYPP